MTKIILDSNTRDHLIMVSEDSEIEGVFVVKDSTERVLRLTVIHKRPNLKSRINIKAVVYDKSKFDFEGVVKIKKGAFDTDTYLKADCLLIGDNAVARAVPSLEIMENNVRAGHGATIGYLDRELITYLMEKGLNKKQCEKLLVKAFLVNRF